MSQSAPRPNPFAMAAFAFVAVTSILWAGGVFDRHSEAPAKLYTVDGCDIYRFTDAGERNYVARCSNGKVATTYAEGDKHITTETK